MRRFSSVLVFLSFCCVAFCQDMASELLETLHTRRVTMNYSFKAGKVSLGSGVVVINGDWYLTRSKGLDVYCDGKSRWVVDTAAKEVYIENAGGTGEFFASMDRILSQVDDLQLTSSGASGVFTDTSSGEVVNFVFSDMKKTEPGEDVSEFRFCVEALDSDWVVTDLRD